MTRSIYNTKQIQPYIERLIDACATNLERYGLWCDGEPTMNGLHFTERANCVELWINGSCLLLTKRAFRYTERLASKYGIPVWLES
jgi:hypothetical protein